MKRILKKLASLKLTIMLLSFSMLLVFLSTLEQVHLGIHEVQSRYFAQWIAWIPLPHTPGSAAWLDAIKIPILGGYALGLLLLINLLAAAPRTIGLKPKKWGLSCIHLGLITLIISGFVSACYQEESQLWLSLGQTGYFSESTYENEIALIDESAPNFDTVYAIDANHLRPGWVISDDRFPFKFIVIEAFNNAAIVQLADNPQAKPSPADSGVALKMRLTAIPQPPTYKENERNAATACIKIETLKGHSLGTWLLSNILDDRFPRQRFEYEGKSYAIALRFKQEPLPIGLKLIEFIHETYPGTDIPKFFASKLEVIESNQPPRAVEIRMNEPLRIHGYTFYQASFAQGDAASMLQVVKNPGWTGPYIGVLLIAMGMTYHFIYRLTRALRPRKSEN